jgi:hypothetical protein
MINLEKTSLGAWKKLEGVFFRLFDLFRLFPLRLLRFFRHLVDGLLRIPNRRQYWWQSEIDRRNARELLWWLLECSIYFLECFGLVEIYETLADLLKFNTRPLRPWEIELAKPYFGNSINWKRVRIDERAFIGPRRGQFCYVSFYTINSWGSMTNSLLLHELTHIWQYEQMGALYLLRALRAQRSKMGYNYGGVSTLKAYLKSGKNLFAFNLEQQCEIVSDHYLLKNGYSPRYGSGKLEDLKTYDAFIRQLQS